MIFLLSLCCALLSTVAVGDGWSLNKRFVFSLVSVPFKYHGIAPEYLDHAPSRLLQVVFPTFEANLGTKVRATEVTKTPHIKWDCDQDDYYTLVMFDCDPLGQDTSLLSELRHWVVGNIHGCDIHQGQTIVDFLPSSPFIDTGYHRFVFLMFHQDGPINFEEPFIRSTQLEGRAYTSMKKFAWKYNLGAPIAGNFYLCDHDGRSDESMYEIEYFPEYMKRAIDQNHAGRATKNRNKWTYSSIMSYV